MNRVNRSKRNLFRPLVAMSTAVLLTCVLWMAVSAGTPLGKAGYLDFSYNGVGFTNSPTGEKPESKLWWNDGFWWGILFNSNTLKYHIYRLNWGEQVWEDTGIAVDDRPKSKSDVLFVEDDNLTDATVNPKLYVASHIYTGQANRIDNALSLNRARLYKFAYNRATQTYTPEDINTDADKLYAVISSDEVEALTLARDPVSGRLWVTFVSQERATPATKNQVFINATTTAGNDRTWTGPLALTTSPIGNAANVVGGDLSAIALVQVPTGNKVAVIWNNSTLTETTNLLHVAYRDANFSPSTATSGWSFTQVPVTQGLDDHINIKSLQANGTGQIFVALKTNAPQSGPSLPHIQMVAVDVSNPVSPTYAIRTYSDNLAKDTRPIIVLDEGKNAGSVTDDTIYLFVTGSDSGSKICYGFMPMKLPLSSLSTNFKAPTLKTPDKNVDDCGVSFIEDSLTGYKDINNATSLKGSFNSTTGLVVLASDNTIYTQTAPSKVYVHNIMGDPPPVVTTRGPGFNATGVSPTAVITATFSKPMSDTTISGTTFKVKGALGPVAGTVSYNPGSRTAIFAPAAPLRANTTYTVEMTNAIKDSSNLVLGGNFRNVAPYVAPVVEQWKFTTGAAAVNFALASYSALETAPAGVITLTLNTTSTVPISVTYTMTNGTATAGEDYTVTTGVVNFPANQRVKSFPVSLLDDLTNEGNETVNLGLKLPVNGLLGLQSTAQLIIIDNEGPPSVQFSTLNPAPESAGVVQIQATLSHSTTTPVAVGYRVAGGTATATADFTLDPAGTVNFPPNTLQATFPLNIVNDLKDEVDESVILELTNPSTGTLGTPGYTATLTILDDDLAPGVKFGSATETVGEAGSVKSVTVHLTAPSEQTITVIYATENISATAGEDYTAASGTLTFAPNEVSKTIDVPIINDSLDEEDEPFDIVLLNAINATIEAPSNAAVTITDDDAEPTLSFATSTLSKSETGGVVVVTVNLSTASGRRVVVDYAATDGTANEGADYDLTEGQLIFAPGETSQTFEVPLLDDTTSEGDETINLTLNNASGAVIDVGGNATLTIVDNEPPPQTLTLAVTKAGTGTGKVTSAPAGVDCGATCSGKFLVNAVVTLTATPDANMIFKGWSGSCTGTTTTCQVTMNAAKAVTATFDPIPTNTPQQKVYLAVVRK